MSFIEIISVGVFQIIKIPINLETPQRIEILDGKTATFYKFLVQDELPIDPSRSFPRTC